MGKAIKISNELAESAQREADLMSRSLARQVEHWANLGRCIERSGQFSHQQVAGFLRGGLVFDELAPAEQAIAVDQLVDALERVRMEESFFQELTATGVGYSGIDSLGRLVRVLPDGSRQLVTPAG